MVAVDQSLAWTNGRPISTAVEAYATDNNSYPNAKDIGELSRFLSPMYMKNLPPNDAWGQRYLYEATECEGEQCQRYYVASGGKDGKLERTPPSANGTQPRMMDGFDADIVYSKGQFVVSPMVE